MGSKLLAGGALVLGIIVAGLVFVARLIGAGQAIERGRQAQSNLKAAAKAKESRDDVAEKSDGDLDRQLAQWLRRKP
jgi:hypothetical protein